MKDIQTHWWLRGLFWGAMMFIFMGVLWPLSQNEVLILKPTVLTFVFWIAAGLFYGWLLKVGSVRWHFRSGNKN